MPLFTINTYKPENVYFEYGLQLLGDYTDEVSSERFISLFDNYIEKHKDIPMPITNVIAVGSSSKSYDDKSVTLSDYRPYELEIVKISEGTVVGVFDFKYTVNLTAGLGIARTIFICCILSIGAIFFSRDALQLVIKPIEGMISKVNRIAKNPLEAAQEEENEALAYERALMTQK